MRAPQAIWRSKLWAKRGETRVIIHVIADAHSVGFKVVAVPKSGKAAILGTGAASTVVAARTAAERLAARLSVAADDPDWQMPSRVDHARSIASERVE